MVVPRGYGGFDRVEQNFIVNVMLRWKPVELRENRCDVTDGGCPGDAQQCSEPVGPYGWTYTLYICHL